MEMPVQFKSSTARPHPPLKKRLNFSSECMRGRESETRRERERERERERGIWILSESIGGWLVILGFNV